MTQPWTVATLGGLITWLVLASWMIAMLRREHPETYQAIGAPGLILGSTPSNNWKTLRFIFSQDVAALGNSRLTRLCYLLRVLFVLVSGLTFLPIFAVLYFQLVRLV